MRFWGFDNRRYLAVADVATPTEGGGQSPAPAEGGAQQAQHPAPAEGGAQQPTNDAPAEGGAPPKFHEEYMLTDDKWTDYMRHYGPFSHEGCGRNDATNVRLPRFSCPAHPFEDHVPTPFEHKFTLTLTPLAPLVHSTRAPSQARSPTSSLCQLPFATW